MNNALLYIAGLLVAVLSALFAVPHFIDWNGYRGVFEEEATRLLGREVRVGGAVNVRLLPTPYVRFEKVRVAESSGGTGEPFFRAEAFTLWLSVPPLLRGVLEAHEIELQRPRLRLAADGDGRGSWTTLNVGQGSLPFAPAGVSLQAVRISDGSIGMATGGGEMQLSGVNGEFQADALEGPYKFQGTMNWRGGERQVRFSTAKPDADGAVRMKSIVTAPQTGNTYVLDGRMTDLRGKTRFDGDIHGKMQIESLGPVLAGGAVPAPGGEAAKAEPPRAARPPQDGQAPFIDVKAVLAADLTAARLGQILLSVENVGQPQLVTGDARIAWAGSPALELALTSRWLDLDRLAGRDPADQPIDTAQALVSALLGQLPNAGRVDVRFDVEQTSLGGEAVSGLGVKLARDQEKGPLEIREMRAGLPGGARIDITGTLAESAALPQLDGALVVRGSSLTRFLKWAGKNPALIEGRTDGPFLVRGKLRLNESELALMEAAAELNGVPLTGEVRHELKTRRRVSVRLDGQSVDLAHVWPGALDWIAAVVPFAASNAKPATEAGSTAAKPAVATAAAEAGGTDLTLRVRVAELIAGTRTLRDVDADLAVDRGRLTIPQLRLSTSDGLEVDIEGEINNATTSPKGVLRGHVSADRPSAVEALFRVLGETAAIDMPRGQIAALAPLRLAGRVALGLRSPTAADIEADGIVQGGRFVASARLDGGWRGWRDATSELSVEADSPDVDQLLRLALGTGGEPQRGRTPRRGQLNLKAQGVPSRGMLTAAELQSAGLSLSYDGPMKLEKGAPSAIDGEVRITADNMSEALDLAGIPIGGAATAVAVDGLLSVTARDNVLSITPRELMIGARKVSGSLIVAQRSGRPSTVTANLELGDVRLADLLTPLLDRRGLVATASAPDIATRMAQSAVSGAPADAEMGPWPDLSFDLQPLDRLDGTIDLTFKRLRIDDGVALGDGRIVAKMEPGRFSVETLSGAALGGRVTGSASFARVKGGVDGKVSLRLADLKPGLLAAESSALRTASKPVTLSLELEGRSQSPRGLIAAMRGKGMIDVARIEIPGLAPGSVATTAEAFVSGRIEPGEGVLTRVLTEAGERETAVLPAGKYEIEAGDGALRVRPITIEGSGGRTAITTTVDLDTLRFDSEWRIDLTAATLRNASAPVASEAAVRPVQLPAVFLVYAGKLGAVAASERRISAGALERELQVRRMEQEVDELERLRREDERRRAMELERQQVLDAERARAAADPAVAAPSSPGGATGPVPPQPTPLQVSPEVTQPGQAPAGSPDAQRSGTAGRPPPAPKPVRRVSPGDEVLRSLTPN